MFKTKHWLTGIIIGGLILSLLLVYYIFNPELDKLFPPCPFHYITGFQCPGCGSQRALHALLHFDFGKAVGHNLLFVLAMPYIAVGLILEYLGGKRRFTKLNKLLYGKNAILLALSFVLGFTILRNIL